MEILLVGNTGYITEDFVEQAFPEGNIRVIGNTAMKTNKKKRVTVLQFPKNKGEFQELFAAYAFDRVVYFSNYLTFHGGRQGEAEQLQTVLKNCATGREIQFVYLAGRDDTGILANAAERLCLYYAESYPVWIKVVRTPYLYSASMQEDYLYRLFRKMDTEGKLVFQEAPEQNVWFLCMRDLAQLLYRIFDSWENKNEILSVPDSFEISFIRFAWALNELKPGLHVAFSNKNPIHRPEPNDKLLRRRYGWFPQISVLEELPYLYRQYRKEQKSRERGLERGKRRLARSEKSLWVLELLVCFVLTELLTWLAGNQMQFRMIDLRLLFIVLMGTVYGMNMGILAAALGSVALMFTYYRNGTDWFTIFYEPLNWIPFIAYFIVGAICGYVQLKNRDDIRFMQKENELIREKFFFLRGLYQDTLENCKAYKKQILGRRDSFGKIYEITKQLDVANPQELYTKIIQILERVLDNHSISVYSLGKDKNHARMEAASDGISRSLPQFLRTEDYREAIEVLKKGEIWRNTKLLKEYPMYMAGIRKDSELLLIVSVQEADYSRMTFYYLNLIKIVCGLAEASLMRILDAQEAAGEEQYVNRTGRGEV